MALVIAAKASRVDAIEDKMFFGAALVGNNVVLTRGDGTTLTLGPIILPAAAKWPVGSIFWNVGSTNPATLLGGGTWERWGKGRIPVSLDETNPRLDLSGDTGGAENVTLDLSQTPAHLHGTSIESATHTHTGFTAGGGDHVHTYYAPVVTTNKLAGTAARIGAGDWTNTLPAGAHNHSVTTYGVSALHTHVIAAQGGGLPHENMPPFITVYMWKRTA